jgi:hypothetical protein
METRFYGNARMGSTTDTGYETGWSVKDIKLAHVGPGCRHRTSDIAARANMAVELFSKWAGASTDLGSSACTCTLCPDTAIVADECGPYPTHEWGET